MFARDNHFGDIPEFHILANAGTRLSLTSLLRRYYGRLFHSSPEIRVIGGANINSGNFIVDGHYVKTLLRRGVDDHLETLPVIADSLRRCSLPAARFIPNDEGEAISRHCGPDGDNLNLFVQEFIDGTFFSGSIPELEACSEMILKMPAAVSHVRPTVHQRSHYQDWNPLETVESVAPFLSKLNPAATPFDAAALKFFPVAKAVVSRQFSGSIDTHQLNHVDLHPHNLLMKTLRPAAILDLESFWAIPANVSIGFALFKLARKTVSKGFVKAEEIRPLLRSNGIDVQALLPFAQLEIARRFLTICKLHYLEQNVLWDSDIFKQANSFAEVEALFA